MSKLYVFGIGGSGAKVIESLIMLLAAGVKVENFDTLVPVLLDPDEDNGNVKNTAGLLDLYENIQTNKTIDNKSDNFFRTQISPLDPSSTNKYKFTLNLGTVKFGDYIGYGSMLDGGKLKKLTELLFSEKTDDENSDYILDLLMKVGFKGNPHIGVIVLNEFVKTTEFTNFLKNNVEDGDALILIGSIFGGTGASGIPILLHNIRNPKYATKDENKVKILKKMPIGVISMLPYYSIGNGNKQEPKVDEIKSAHFAQKTKSALRYYNNSFYYDKNEKGESVSRLESMYYISNNKHGKPLIYAIGGEAQANKAFFTELYAALAILDFAENARNAKGDDDKKNVHVRNILKCKQFQEIATDTEIQFGHNHFNIYAEKIIKEAISKLLLFAKYMDFEYKTAFNNIHAWTENWKNGAECAIRKIPDEIVKIDNNNKLIGKLVDFFCGDQKDGNMVSGFNNWLNGIGEMGQKFAPFKLDIKESELDKLIKNYESDEKLVNFEKFSKAMDKYAKKQNNRKFDKPLDRLLSLNYKASKDMYEIINSKEEVKNV